MASKYKTLVTTKVKVKLVTGKVIHWSSQLLYKFELHTLYAEQSCSKERALPTYAGQHIKARWTDGWSNCT